MEIDVKQDCVGVDWETVAETLKCVGMASFKEGDAMIERGFTE